MFQFLKRFIKEEPEQKKVQFSELKTFFNEHSKEVTKELNDKIKETKEKIEFEIQKAKENVEILKKAELRNKSIPVRAMQFMDGNRESYTKAVTHLLNQIVIENDYDAIIKFCNEFQLTLYDFTKSTGKAYQILQEFFAHESRDIALNIKQIDALILELRKLAESERLDRLKKLREHIKDVEQQKEQKKIMTEALHATENKKIELKKTKENLEKLRTELKDSNEYSELISLQELKKKITHEIAGIEGKLIHSFAVIEDALKKYRRMTMEDTELLTKYIENPVSALNEDKELQVLKYFEGIEKNIDRLELKERKAEKTKEEITKLTKEFFLAYVAEHGSIKEKLDNAQERLQKIDVKNKLDDITKKIEDASEQLKSDEQKLAELHKKLEDADIDKLIGDLEKEIKETFNVDVIIS